MESVKVQTLVAYLDGELTANEVEQLEERLARDGEARRNLEAARALVSGARTVLAVRPSHAFVGEVISRTESSRRTLARWIPAAIAIAAGVMVVGVVQRPDAPVARGTSVNRPEAHLGIEAYAHPASDPLSSRRLAPGGAIARGDGLSFVTYNRSGAPVHFGIFARESDGTVHWFYPDGERGGGVLVPLVDEPSMVPLPEGVTLTDPSAGPLQLIAVFSEAPLSIDGLADVTAADPRLLTLQTIRLHVLDE